MDGYSYLRHGSLQNLAKILTSAKSCGNESQLDWLAIGSISLTSSKLAKAGIKWSHCYVLSYFFVLVSKPMLRESLSDAVTERWGKIQKCLIQLLQPRQYFGIHIYSTARPLVNTTNFSTSLEWRVPSIILATFLWMPPDLIVTEPRNVLGVLHFQRELNVMGLKGWDVPLVHPLFPQQDKTTHTMFI